jgi:hypothetical protein
MQLAGRKAQNCIEALTAQIWRMRDITDNLQRTRMETAKQPK